MLFLLDEKMINNDVWNGTSPDRVIKLKVGINYLYNKVGVGILT